MTTESATTLEVVEPEKEITTLIATSGIQPEVAQSLQSAFAPLFVEARSIIEKSKAINVTDVSQTLEMKVARAYRLALRKIRTTGDATRKTLKEDSLRRSKAIDGFFNILVHITDGEETRLADAEQFALKKEEERKATLKVDRQDALKPYGLDTSFIDLGAMDDATFTQLLENSRAAHEKRQEDARRAEQARIEAENARLKEEARIRDENARLKREADEREAAAKAERERLEAVAAEERRKAAEAAEAARIEKERLAAENEAKLAAERAQAAETLRLQQEQAALERKQAQEEADRVAREKQAAAEADALKAKEAAKKAKADADKKLAQERAAREKLEQEAKERQEAENLRLQQESIARLAASLAPDREKLTAYVAAVRALTVPAMASDSGKAIEANFVQRREAYLAYLERAAATL